MVEQVRNFLNEWSKNEERCTYRYAKAICKMDNWYDDEICFEDELESFLANIEGVKYNYIYVGGFDSPGYSIDCYCLSIVDENGEVVSFPINFEN